MATATERQNTGRLVAEDRRGRLQVSVWENQTQNGPRHNATLKRSYQDPTGTWKETKISLPLYDLLQAARMLEWANDRSYHDIASSSHSSGQSEEPADVTETVGGPTSVDGIPF